MADHRPVIRWSRIEGDAEGDCACPDTGWFSPQVCWAGQEGYSEQDCACPEADLAAPQRPQPDVGLWHRPADLYRAPLPGHHEIVFVPAPSTGIAVLNAPARHILDSFAIPQRLPQVTEALPDLDPADVSHIAWDLARHSLLQPVDETVAPCQSRPHTLTAWLHVTNRCNLNCLYCYVTRSDRDMDEATAQAAVEAVFRSAMRHGFRAVKLKYAGGEPTLNFALVRSLHNRAAALAERHGLVLQEALLSNGLALSDAILRDLREMGIRLAISLDGVGATHDALRGAGTFVRVARSLDRAIALGLEPHVSITITAYNVEGLADVVAFVLDRDLPFNLNFYRTHERLAEGMDLGVETERLIERVRAALSQIEARLPRRSALGSLDRANFGYPHRRPCGVDHSYLTVDPRGRIARCQMEMGNPVGDVWHGDPLTTIRTAPAEWRNVVVDDRRGCRDCVWRHWCAGGCPLLTYRLTGRDDLRSPYCEVYRALFPDILRLEGLRLLNKKYKRGPKRCQQTLFFTRCSGAQSRIGRKPNPCADWGSKRTP